jgi:hypothetical protein
MKLCVQFSSVCLYFSQIPQQHTPPVIKPRGSASGNLARSSSSTFSYGRLSRASSSSSVSSARKSVATTPSSPKLGRPPSAGPGRAEVRNCEIPVLVPLGFLWFNPPGISSTYRSLQFSDMPHWDFRLSCVGLSLIILKLYVIDSLRLAWHTYR